MGYENIGKVKTIVLPRPSGTMTRKEYFDKYGIDVGSFFGDFKTREWVDDDITYKEVDAPIELDLSHSLVLISRGQNPLDAVNNYHHGMGYKSGSDWESTFNITFDSEINGVVSIGLLSTDLDNPSKDKLLVKNTRL